MNEPTQSPDQGPEQRCTNRFSDGSKIFPNRDCCKGPERVAPEPTAERIACPTCAGMNDLVALQGKRIAELEKARDASDKALAFIKDRITSNDDFDSDELVKAIEERIGRYSQSIEWFAPKMLAEEVAELRAANAQLERELTIERGESAETSRILHEQDEDVKRLTMERDEARAERDKWKDAAFDGETEELVRAQLAASEKGRQWQPIETAPKDGGLMGFGGRRILGWCPDWDDTFTVKWSPNRPAPHWTLDSGAITETAPTHWMPLPKAPDAAMKEAK